VNRIKVILKEQGRTQTWLSQKLGKSFTQINNYVQNKVQPPIEVLYEIADILDVNVKDLLMDNKKK